MTVGGDERAVSVLVVDDEADLRTLVRLILEFEPSVKLLGAAMAVGFQGLADRMVDDFVRVADRGDAA